MRNMNDILRQAQVMQNKIAKVQQDLGEHSYEASSGGGMVKARFLASRNCASLSSTPRLSKAMMLKCFQDLILAAVNEAGRIARETMEREMSAISGGIKLPGLF